MILYTNFLIPTRFDGYTIGFASLIRPQFKADKSLAAHEETHQRQFWHSLGLNLLLSQSSDSHRLAYEVEAYKVQLAQQMHRLMSQQPKDPPCHSSTP